MIESSEKSFLIKLFEIIEDRKNASPEESYTARLFLEGSAKIHEKIKEESKEVIEASESEGEKRVIEEACDLIYHLYVLLSYRNISLDEIEAELLKRHHPSY